MATTLPPHYRAAKLRCVLPYHADVDLLGVAFDLADGEVLRIALDGDSARRMICLLTDYLASGVQSPSSSDMPSVDGSMTPGQSQCPPVRSSSARCGDV